MGKSYIWVAESQADRNVLIAEIEKQLAFDQVEFDIWDADAIDKEEMESLLRRFSLYYSGHRATVIFQADQLSILVQSMLLKPVEELSENQSVILVTGQPSAISNSLRSRFQEIRSDYDDQKMIDSTMVKDLIEAPLARVFSFTSSLTPDQIRSLLAVVDVVFEDYLKNGKTPHSILTRFTAQRTRCGAFPSRVTIESLLLTMHSMAVAQKTHHHSNSGVKL